MYVEVKNAKTGESVNGINFTMWHIVLTSGLLLFFYIVKLLRIDRFWIRFFRKKC